MAEEFLNITQVAERFGVRERVIAALVKQGNIPYIRIGKFIRFRWSLIQAWCDELPGSNPLNIHSAILPVGHSVTKGIQEITLGTSDPILGLVRGPKGRNRERLAKG